ncbi:LysE family transporter [Primorskyibacter aestuariivivens]|uniref:LysE family translocator n=1 Tax=Primorskyibacter aestuariivivens TaxID=1888912 RepID=UPI00230116C8|nr:LysE family transporter [Primorskyibacter aestuariivivens]MDA7429781.1 LysE family transporter [Primorskyibacter aestuariivivens]
MGWEHILAFNLTLLAALASPGPALLLALRTSLVAGSAAGIATGLGLGLMAAIWTALALLGLDAVFALVPWAYMVIKIAGALYLLWIAWGMWRDAHRPLTESTQVPRGKAFRTGFLVNLGNPKSVLFASAVLLVIFPPDLSLAEKALIVGNHLIVEWIAYTLFAVALATRPARDSYLRLKPVLDRVAAGVLGLLGLRLLVSR